MIQHHSHSVRLSRILTALALFTLALGLTACGGSSSSSGGVTSGLVAGHIQGTPLSLTDTVTTLAGTAGTAGSANGTAASFNGPIGVTTDGTNLYVDDSNNNEIRKIVIATGAVTTFAGSGAGGNVQLSLRQHDGRHQPVRGRFQQQYDP